MIDTFTANELGLVRFTRRTDYPKLNWLVGKLKDAGIRCFIVGETFHAPISWVHEDDLDAAWEILDPVDDLPDDHEMFTQ